MEHTYDLNNKRVYLSDPYFPYYRNRKDVLIRLSNSNLKTIKKKIKRKKI